MARLPLVAVAVEAAALVMSWAAAVAMAPAQHPLTGGAPLQPPPAVAAGRAGDLWPVRGRKAPGPKTLLPTIQSRGTPCVPLSSPQAPRRAVRLLCVPPLTRRDRANEHLTCRPRSALALPICAGRGPRGCFVCRRWRVAIARDEHVTCRPRSAIALPSRAGRAQRRAAFLCAAAGST